MTIAAETIVVFRITDGAVSITGTGVVMFCALLFAIICAGAGGKD